MKTLRSQHCDGALGKAGTFLRDARVQRLACFWDHARHMPATDSECARRTSPWSYTVHRCSLPICARASRPGRDALTGVDFFGKPLRAIARFSHQDAQTPPSPRVGEGGRGDAYRGGCFGKPLRAISRFSHQDAQTPPSPRVGERGWGDFTGVDVLARPCVPSPVSAIRMPRLPLLPVWEKGAGGMRGKSVPECGKSRISPKKSTLESRGDEGQRRTGMQNIAHLSQKLYT